MNSGFGAGWRQVVACLFLMGAAAAITSGYGVIAVPLAAEFEPSRMVLMLTMTIMALVTGLLSPIFGAIMDRSSLRLMMALGAALIIAGFAALSFATSFIHVLIIYGVLLAPANVLVGPMPATILLSRWFVKRRGAALGFAIAGISLGGFAYPPVTQTLLDANDWRTAMRLLAVIIAVFTLPAIFLIIERPSDRGLHPDGAAEPDPEAPRAAVVAAGFSLRGLLTDSTFWILATVFTIVLSGMTGMVTNLVPLAIDEGIDASAAALLISIYAACGFVAKLIFAAVADRLTPRLLLAIGAIGFAAGMACMIGVEAGYAVMALGVGLIGLFGGLMMPLQGLLIPQIFGQAVVGRVIGILSVAVLVGVLVMPPLFGLVFDITGNYDAIFLAFAAVAVGLVLLIPSLRVHPKAVAAAPA